MADALLPTAFDVLGYLTDAYPHKNVPTATLRLMNEALDDAYGLFLMEAARQHVQSSRWFPTVAELRQKLDAVRERREGLADVLLHERLARYQQAVAERPHPPRRNARCLRARVYFTDEELYEMEVGRGTMPPPEAREAQLQALRPLLARLRANAQKEDGELTFEMDAELRRKIERILAGDQEPASQERVRRRECAHGG